MGDNSSQDVEWKDALGHVWGRAVDTVRKETKSAKKRDAFAALARIAHAAGAVGAKVEDEVIEDKACLGRLQRVCNSFGEGAQGAVYSKSPNPNGPPAAAEDCLLKLGRCVRSALCTLRARGEEGRLLEDAARLVQLVERGLIEMGADLVPLLSHELGNTKKP